MPGSLYSFFRSLQHKCSFLAGMDFTDLDLDVNELGGVFPGLPWFVLSSSLLSVYSPSTNCWQFNFKRNPSVPSTAVQKVTSVA